MEPLPKPYRKVFNGNHPHHPHSSARVLLDSEPGLANCCWFLGEHRLQVEMLSFHVSFDIEAIVSWENQAYTDRGFTLFAFSLPGKAVYGFPGK